LPCKSGKTSGCNLFALLSLTQGLRFSKNLLCPCLRTAHQFYLISPEADLLTGRHNESLTHNVIASDSVAISGGHSLRMFVLSWSLV